MKPIIGIIGRSDFSTEEKSTISVFDKYRQAIIHYGGIPIIILPSQTIDYHEIMPRDTQKLTNEEKSILKQQVELCHGIIMPGGDRIYEYDNYICDYCNKKQIPLLGICMGMQIMCNYNNENRNIKNETNGHYSQNNYKHLVKIDNSSKLFNIIKEKEILVNSLHNYHVPNSGSYQAVAYCDDIIEAIEKKEDLFNIGVQWHPEKNYSKDLNSKNIFTNFIEASNIYKKKKI